MSYTVHCGFNSFRVVEKRQRWGALTRENLGLTGHILIFCLFVSFLCASEFTGILFTIARSKKGSRNRKKGDKGRKLSVITNQNFSIIAMESYLFCHWEGITFMMLHPLLLLALLDIYFNMNVFSSQQNGIIMRYAKCITRLEMKLIVFSPQCKGKNDFQIMLLILLGIWFLLGMLPLKI